MERRNNELQDSLRGELVANQNKYNQCDFEIIEKNVSDDENTEDNESDKQVFANKENLEQVKKYMTQNESINQGSFPAPLHRSQLNLQKTNPDLVKEGKNEHEDSILNNKENISKNANKEKVKICENGSFEDRNKINEKYNLTFQINANEIAKLEWTNPVSKDEIKEVTNLKDMKLHEARFDFKGKLRIQIDETNFNKTYKEIFNQYDGLYHHNEEPLNSGYTIPELLLLCGSTCSNQVCLALKTLQKIFINLRLKVKETNTCYQHLITKDVTNEYCFGFTWERFNNYLQKDVMVLDKLFCLLDSHSNKNVELSSINAIASLMYPNNDTKLEKNVIYDTVSSSLQIIQHIHNYELFCFDDFMADAMFFQEGCNPYFHSNKKQKCVQKKVEDPEESVSIEEMENPNDSQTSAFLKKLEESQEEKKNGTDNKKNILQMLDDKAKKKTTNRNMRTSSCVSVDLVKVLQALKHIEPFTDIPNLKRVNIKTVQEKSSTKNNNERLFNNISSILENNFGIAEVENACVCLLIGLVHSERQNIRIIDDIRLVTNLKNLYDSHIVGTQMYNEKRKKKWKIENNKDTEFQPMEWNYNLIFNLITLLKYLSIYNFDEQFLEKLDVLPFLLFQRMMPFQKMEKPEPQWFYLAAQVLRVFRLLEYTNIYFDSVDFFHDILIQMVKMDIAHLIPYTHFISQVFLYIATHNALYADMDLSGILYLKKVMNIINKILEKVEQKMNYQRFTQIQALLHGLHFLYSYCLCIHTKKITDPHLNDQYVVLSEILQIINRIQKMGIQELNKILDKQSINDKSIVERMIQKAKETPNTFIFMLYDEEEIDWHLFVILYLHVLNAINCIHFICFQLEKEQLVKMNLEEKKEICNINENSNRIIAYFTKHMFQIESILNSQNIFLPVAYWFYYSYTLVNIPHLLYCSLVYSSSLPLTYFCLRSIFLKDAEKEEDIQIETHTLSGVDCLIIFLQKYLTPKYLIFHTKKNFFYILWDHIFKQCKNKWDEMNKTEIDILRNVLHQITKQEMVTFLSNEFPRTLFIKLLIQMYITNNDNKHIGDSLCEIKSIYSHMERIAHLYLFKMLHHEWNTTQTDISSNEKKEFMRHFEDLVRQFMNKQKGGQIKCKITHLLYQNKIECIYNKPKLFPINKELLVVLYEKIISSFKSSHFFNPLFLTFLLFFGSSYFPKECIGLLYNDKELITLLTKNVFIYFHDLNHYSIYTHSSFYGNEEAEFIIDISQIFPPLLSFLINTPNFEIDKQLDNYFHKYNTHSSHYSLIDFILFVKSKLQNKQDQELN